MVESKTFMPSTVLVGTELIVQSDTWLRARLLEIILGEASYYVPDLKGQLDAYLSLGQAIASSRREPLADCLYAGVLAIGLARQEGIQLSSVFEQRVSDLVGLILADKANGISNSQRLSPSKPRGGSTISIRTKSEQKKKGS